MATGEQVSSRAYFYQIDNWKLYRNSQDGDSEVANILGL